MTLHRALLSSCAVLGGCSGSQSVLNGYGPQAHHLGALFWTFTAILTVVWLLTLVALGAALWKRSPQPASELAIARWITAAAVATAIVLLVLTGLSYATQKDLYGGTADAPLAIKVTGHQWWWDVRYESDDPSQIFNTANELHIPTGRPIEIKLSTADVIHSFWVPGLFGKMDLVNGIENKIQFSADRPGTLRGQCAEFCGYQHAHMAFTVAAETPANFETWRANQLRPASLAASERGREIFLGKPCASCHAVRGTTAAGRVGPDLTHLFSRQHLASGTLPMTRGALAAWIVDPQTIKPGAQMPAVALAPADIHPLLDYLEGLR
jgi:cytochrome c oxidase subunit 2